MCCELVVLQRYYVLSELLFCVYFVRECARVFISVLEAPAVAPLSSITIYLYLTFAIQPVPSKSLENWCWMLCVAHLRPPWALALGAGEGLDDTTTSLHVFPLGHAPP